MKNSRRRDRFYSRLAGKIGVSNLRSGHELTSLVEHGLPTRVIRSLRRGGLSDSEIYGLIVPRRTLAHRLIRHEPLSRDESDKAVRVARIAALAEQVFGEPERAWRWLRSPKRHFHGRSPIQMLATDAGSRLVEEVIARIDEGLAA